MLDARETHGSLTGHTPDTRRIRAVNNFQTPGGRLQPPPGFPMRARLAVNGRKAVFLGLAYFGTGVGDGGHSALPGRSGFCELVAALGGLRASCFLRAFRRRGR